MNDSERRIMERLSRAMMAAICDDAEVLMELFAAGLSFEQIGRQLGIGTATAFRRVLRIRSHLAKHGILPPRWESRDHLRSAKRNIACNRGAAAPE